MQHFLFNCTALLRPCKWRLIKFDNDDDELSQNSLLVMKSINTCCLLSSVYCSPKKCFSSRFNCAHSKSNSSWPFVSF